MPTYRLGSSPLVHAPGLIVWAINAYAFPRDRAAILRVVIDTWSGLPDETARRLLSGDLAYRVENDAIVIDVVETGVAEGVARIANSTGEGRQ
jgi:hypothetical protein